MSQPRQFIDPLAQVMDLHSDINGADYELRIRLPQSYGQGDNRYPVFVVLDAESAFHMASDIVALEAAWWQAPFDVKAGPEVPEVIVASIALPCDPPNPVRRNFEYMPASEVADLSAPMAKYMAKVEKLIGRKVEFGGADTFLAVLRDEILTAISKQYRVDESRRMLFGGSASGCFAAFALFKEPALFTDYVIVSPALPPEIFRMEAAWAERHDDLPARVLLTVGQKEIFDEITLVSNVAKLSEVLTSRRYPGLKLTAWFIDQASHVETPAPSISRAIKDMGLP